MKTVLLCATALALAAGSVRGIEFRSSFQSFKIAVRPGETISRTFELQLTPGQPRVVDIQRTDGIAPGSALRVPALSCSLFAIPLK